MQCEKYGTYFGNDSIDTNFDLKHDVYTIFKLNRVGPGCFNLKISSKTAVGVIMRLERSLNQS